MSCNNWEEGTLKLPGAEWKRVRDALAAAFNARQAQALALAQELHTRLVAIKSDRGTKTLQMQLYQVLNGNRDDEQLFARVCKMDSWAIESSVLKRDEKTGKVTLAVPKKKDFPEALSTKHTEYAYGEFAILVDHKSKSLTWKVRENNRAVEMAREHRMGVEFFRLMGTVKWTRGTGGTISGNDEYCREQREEGGGANYVTARFGPLGERTDPLVRLKGRRVTGISRGLSQRW